jgi:hypothetical protein
MRNLEQMIIEAAIKWEQIGTSRFLHSLNCRECGDLLAQAIAADDAGEEWKDADECEVHRDLGDQIRRAQDDLRLATKALLRALGEPVLSI